MHPVSLLLQVLLEQDGASELRGALLTALSPGLLFSALSRPSFLFFFLFVSLSLLAPFVRTVIGWQWCVCFCSCRCCLSSSA